MVQRRHQGLYLDIEQVGARFLQTRGYGRTAPLYRCGQSDCELKDTPATSWQEAWTQKTKDGDDDDPESLDPADFPPLHEFLKLLNHTPPERFDEALAGAMDVDEYLRFYAISAIVSNDYEEDSRSYLARSEAAGRWHYVPWDLNNTRLIYNRRSSLKHRPAGDRPIWQFSAYDPVVQERVVERSRMWPDMRPTWSTLNTRLREQPELRRRALDTLEWWTKEVFAGDFWAGRVEAQLALITPSVRRDPHVPQDYFARAATFHAQYAERRKAWLLARIAEERAAMEAGALLINEVSREGWVELHNPTDRAVDAGGLWVSPDPRHPAGRQLPSPLSVAPGGFVLLGAQALGFSPQSTRQLGLFRQPDGSDPVEVLLQGSLPTDGTSRGRYPDGGGWRLMPSTPNEPNAR